MELDELFSEATAALVLNKMRSGLATLGIIIGIAAVITLVSLGQSSQKSVESQIQSLGANLLTVIPGIFRPGNLQSASGTAPTLTLDDARAVAKLANIVNVSAELLRRTAVVAGRNTTNTQVVGVLPSYRSVRKVELASGTFISDTDNNAEARVAVLGPAVVSNLFGDGVNPVGQNIRINKVSFKVIGATVSKGGSGFGGNQDDIVIVPLLTAQKQLFGVSYIGSISIEVVKPEEMDIVRNEVGYLILARHKITDPANADFTIFSQQDILGAAAQITGTFTALLSGIAAISLLVGGIGIMNIMLVTVIERTREIGLRKALGAKKRSVVAQFLVESIILTLLGGLIGMVLGVGLSYLIAKLINLPFMISLSAVFLGVFVSGGIGILFGWYPANKAASLNPIEALRYE